MDSVINRVEGKCLFDLHFIETSFILVFLQDVNIFSCVIQIINLLYKVLGRENSAAYFLLFREIREVSFRI